MSAADLLRFVDGKADFTAANREHKVLLDEEILRGVRDINLQLYASPTSDPLNDGQLFIGVDDLRLYLNGDDYTNEYKEQLKANLALLDRKMVRDGYQAGASAYSGLMDRLKMMVAERAGDAAFVEEQLTSDNWSASLDRLGDRRNAGWSGNLHLFNFLYRYVPLKPVSLLGVLRARNSVPDFASWHLTAAHDHLDVTFSCGAAPSFGDIDSAFWPGGRLHYAMTIIAANPLEPKIREILARLSIVVSLTESLRLQYIDPLKTEIEALKGEIEGNNSALSLALEELKRLIEQAA